jgi:hypothetical protein
MTIQHLKALCGSPGGMVVLSRLLGGSQISHNTLYSKMRRSEALRAEDERVLKARLRKLRRQIDRALDD